MQIGDATATVVVNPAPIPTPTTTSLQAAPPSPTFGQTLVLTATVSPSSASGRVTFYNSQFAMGNPVALNGGVASFSTSTLNPGTHQLTATYGGDIIDLSSTSTIYVTVGNAPTATTTALAAVPNPSVSGQNVTLTATVTPASATGTVAFFDGGNSIGTGPLSNGTATFSTSSLSAGSHSLTASYRGDANNSVSSSSAVTETVSQVASTTSLQAAPLSSTPGQTVVITATVSPSSSTGTVTFLDGPASLGSANLIGGIASISTSTLSAGNHSLTASYGGDANDSSSTSSPVTESVSQLTPTTTTVAASPNPSTPGQKVTLTATVTPAAAAGSISFIDSGALLGTGILGSGVATLSTSSLSIGSHSLTASYSGNPTYAASSSQPVSESVGEPAATPTTTSLAAAPNPSTPGQNVTLTATVTPASATGTVSFLDGANLLGTGPLANGVAAFSTSSLSTASHSLTASYAGDANDAPSTSLAVNQSVTAAGSRTITSFIPSMASVGSEPFTLTVNGTGFSSGAVINWNGTPLATTFISVTQVTGAVPANLVASPGIVIITVVTPAGTTGGAAFVVGSQAQPSPVSDTPASGVGAAQSFTFQFSDPAGYQSLGVVNVLINDFLDGRSACYLAYVLPSNTLVLVDDGGDAGGPYAGSIVLGSSGSIQNNQCSVTLVSAVSSGTTLTLVLDIAFKPVFGGNRVMYMAARDLGAGNSNWQALGVWQVPFTPSGTIVVAGVTPGRGAVPSGTSQEIYVTLTDTNGAGDFGVVDVLINNFIDGRQACYLAYVAASGALILLDDPGDAAGPYAGAMALNGGAGSIQNSQCMVSGAGSAVSTVSNTLTLTLNVTFKAAFSGNRVVYAAGRDSAGGNNTDWQAMGTSTVQ